MSHIGRETNVTIQGKQYKLSRLDVSILREFSEWYYKECPNPLALAAQHIKDFPPDLQKILLNQAWEDSKKRREFDTPEVREFMATIAGGGKIISLLLAKNHPDLTEDDALNLATAYFEEQAQPVIDELVLQGYTPEEAFNFAMEEALSGGTFRRSSEKVRRELPNKPSGLSKDYVREQGLDEVQRAPTDRLDGVDTPNL